jgi:hypothetical protein
MVSSQQLPCTMISMLPCSEKRDLSKLQKLSAYELFIFSPLFVPKVQQDKWMARHIKINY